MRQYIKNSIIIIIIIVMLGIMYWKTSSTENTDKIAGLCGNTMTGLVTGLVIYYLGNYKNVTLKNKENQIMVYETLISNGRNIKNNIYAIINLKNILIFDVIDWMAQAMHYFEEYNKYLKKETITEEIKILENYIGEYSYSKQLDDNVSKEEVIKLVSNSIKSILLCNIDLNKELANLRREANQLNKSIF